VADFLKGLNEPQRDAVENINGSSLVLAGAGSGKTRVLTYRIAHLLSKGIKSYNILSLTFTNKAASEMKIRIANLVGEENCKNIWMGTFHSIFSRILRFEAQKLGFTSNFTIYDTSDTKSVIKKIIKELNLDEEKYKPNDVLSKISNAKNNLIPASTYFKSPNLIEHDRRQGKYEIANIYKTYSNRCKKADAMDFDDLLLYTNILFRDFPEVLAKYQDKFKFILVDEYQDTNFAQYLIVKKLSATHKNLCVVGDDAQSIYSFRGAKIENILNFKKDYPEYNLYKLEQNYRSTQTIVNAANSIIANNKSQIPKNTFSENPLGERIKILKSITDSEEGFLISNAIAKRAKDENRQYSDFAILYRTNAQSRIFEESLNKLNIPCKIHGGLSFFQRKEIKDLLAYIRLIINNKDEEALLRIINYPARGIGKTTTDKLEIVSNKTGMPIWEILANADKLDEILPTGTISKLQSFHNLIISYTEDLETSDAYTLAYRIADSTGMINDLKNGTSPDSMSKYENLEELLNGAKEFSEKEEQNKLTDYLEKIALFTDIDEEKKTDDSDKVTLMTVHSSKGLEFKHIYIVGLEETLFPSSISSISEKDIEEERRLFYVALTRGEISATLSYATSRRKWGKLNNCTPSRFITEIDEQYLELPGSISPEAQQSRFDTFAKRERPTFDSFKPQKPPSEFIRANRAVVKRPKSDFKADPPEMMKESMTIEHEKFGIGKIIKFEGSMPHTKATVIFENSGEKKLLLKFAKLRIVEQ